jgi:hypothetical protein
MKKILLGIKTNSASYSSTSSEGYSCGTMEASQVDIVMSGTEEEIREAVSKKREARKQLEKLSDRIEFLEDSERWEEIDEVREEFDRISLETREVNYPKLIMVDGIEL